MANTIRIKRRAAGNPGAPIELANAELAYNEVDDTLYYGKGVGGAGGTATTVEPIAGRGAFATLAGDQSIGGEKTFTGQIFVPTPTHASHAVSKAYADAIAAGTSIVLSGDITGSGIGSVTATLANAGTAGTYTKVTTDAKGRVVAGTTLADSDIPTIPASRISDFDTQVRTNRLDQLAAPASSVTLNAQRITGLAEPVAQSDAATKNYVDLTVQGLTPKQSVKVASTANIAALSGTLTIDSIALIVGDRVLVKDQTIAHQNGIYLVADGAWARAPDADTWVKLVSAYVFVEQGAVNADNGFLFTVDRTGTLGSTAVTVVQFNGAGQILAGAGLTKSGNQIDVGAGAGIAVAADTVGLTGQALALHSLSASGIFARTGVDTVAARSIAASGDGISVSNGDGVLGNPTVGLAAALASIGALTPATDRMVFYTGAAAAALTNFTAFARTLVASADAAAARATLGLGTISTQSAASVAITGGTITGISLDGGTF